jgi:hypothetical protein
MLDKHNLPETEPFIIKDLGAPAVEQILSSKLSTMLE